METIELSPAVLSWAASQAGEGLHELAVRVSKKSVDKITAGKLTYAQVLKYAKLAGVPLGFLFLPEPPEQRKPPLADFRTLPDAHPLSKDFFDTFDDIEFKHSWIRERLKAEGAEPLEFVGKYGINRPAPEALATEIRTHLDFNEAVLRDVKNPDQLFSFLVDQCEKNGLFVFKNGVVGNNTSRPLSIAEFRGFAIADPVCPIIFINGADAAAAWVFTLAHELAHIWIGDSGISDAAPTTHNKTERYCNAVAGEFLVPKKRFLAVWEELPAESSDVRLEVARRTFKVSKTVVARRAYDFGLISHEEYFEVYNLARKAAKDKKSTGGDFYRSLAVRNSKALSMQISGLAASGTLNLSEAGRLLNTTPNNVLKLHEKQNAIPI
ncbi:ImmA/IrrE family metallo-endopeptidase [Massilia yuzhufengensis]|uniref:Zn-dependent peptidase ImmA, M78 family n=1 Tax=Massilia yuzhufengensis TaxID=1164594 RepID=A0A1I1VPL5_9BURK|nr:ImmA/IrrE family metallo-endopeptidase [Massilia yuzhufengensis]SFD82973.1 Zn-dependent peptidase ImmA, M78 family [Massilia yuzhufengensis]